MKMFAFAIKDKKADCFFMPFYMETEAQAKRVVVNTALDTGSSLNAFAGDFALYKLGLQDFETGKFTEIIEPVAEVQSLIMAYQMQNGDDNYVEDTE